MRGRLDDAALEERFDAFFNRLPSAVGQSLLNSGHLRISRPHGDQNRLFASRPRSVCYRSRRAAVNATFNSQLLQSLRDGRRCTTFEAPGDIGMRCLLRSQFPKQSMLLGSPRGPQRWDPAFLDEVSNSTLHGYGRAVR